jgi:hypothetical protein
MPHPAIAVEEHVIGDTPWVAVRARGADWSWLTRDEAVRLGQQWARPIRRGGIGRHSYSSLTLREIAWLAC